MSLATGVVERVPGAYYSDERQAILEAARAFAMKEVLPVANRLDPEHGSIQMAPLAVPMPGATALQRMPCRP